MWHKCDRCRELLEQLNESLRCAHVVWEQCVPGEVTRAEQAARGNATRWTRWRLGLAAALRRQRRLTVVLAALSSCWTMGSVCLDRDRLLNSTQQD